MTARPSTSDTTTPDASTPDASPVELGWTTVATPDGPFTLLFDDTQTVYASGWTEAPDELDALIDASLRGDGLSQRTPGAAADAVLAYYAGDFDAPSRIAVRHAAGPFIRDCWSTLRTVGPGAPVTYSQLAERAGRPKAVRAAARCCVLNVANLFVPCHRVVRFDGTLGGYRYGIEMKRRLLDREAADLGVAV